MDVTQGKLAMGFRTGGVTCWEEEYPAMAMCNAVFGGTTLSKLFMNVREKLSLCYYASSTLEKMKGLILVSSGIEFDKFQQARDEILHQLEEIRQGNMEDWELEGTRRTMIGAHLATLDVQDRQEDFWLGQTAAGLETGIEELVAQLREQFPAIATILLNVNAKNTNVILGSETHPLYGPGYLEDTLCGVPVRLGPLSFYQVNTLAAEQLYGIAAQYAQLTPDDLLLDLYCGMGTIGLSMVDHCRELVGVEIVPEAIESAKANAARMGDAIATKSRFFCADAGAAATRLAAEGLRPDVIVLDPPRKGCDEATLSAVVKMNPQRVVYVSCNPATAARDAKWLETQGYRTEKVQPVDLFPRTKHCEAVLLLTKLHVERHIEVDVSMDELDVTAAESKATYNEIREHVWEHHQLKVSNLYIAQVKQKHGIIERENYHKAKNENAKQPQCPKEKEDAIVEALKHFQMI